jgi:hypothetical protein
MRAESSMERGSVLHPRLLPSITVAVDDVLG